MKIFVKKYKIALSVLFFIVFIVLIFLFIIKPMIIQIDAKSNKIQEIITMQENREKRMGELPDLRVQFEEIRAQEPKLVELLSRERAVELIEKIEAIAEATGNSITITLDEKENASAGSARRTEKKPEEEESILSSLPSSEYLKMKITISGKYANILNFMEKIENIEYYSDIIAINVSAKQEKNSLVVSRSNLIQSGTSPETKEPDGENIPREAELDAAIEIVFYVNK